MDGVSPIVLFCVSLNLWGLVDFVNSRASEGHIVSHEPYESLPLYATIESHNLTPHY